MPQASPPSSDQRSISELLRELTTQSSSLAQKEIELAKAEMAQKGKRLGLGAGAFSGAGLFALLAVGAATAAAIPEACDHGRRLSPTDPQHKETRTA